MPICAMCGEEFEHVTKCKICGETFYAECGKTDEKLCTRCLENEDYFNDQKRRLAGAVYSIHRFLENTRASI